MRQEQLLNYIVQLESRLSDIGEDMKQVKSSVVELIEENVTLRKQIEHYREAHGEPHEASYKDNTLQKLYDEGFHVCNIQFASNRNGAECLFCRDFISVE